MGSIVNNGFLRTGLGGLTAVFPKMIEFASFISASVHVWVWTCLLVLRHTMFDLASLLPATTVGARNLVASLAASADECAVNLCQSIAYLADSDYGSAGPITSGPALHYADEGTLHG